MNLYYLLAAYLIGVAVSATIALLAWAAGNIHVNDFGEFLSLVGFCVFWPLTVAYLAFGFIALLLLGWRGGPIW